MPGGHWQIWKDFVLKSTGFPVSAILALNSEAASAAADEATAARHEARRCKLAALEALRCVPRDSDPSAFSALRRRRRHVLKGTTKLGDGGPCEDGLVRALETQGGIDGRYREVFEHEVAIANRRIETLALESRFHEATLWQNPQAARRARQALLTRDRRQRSYRKAVDLIAMQLQRYAVKNETIGFFGPVGWARLSDQAFVIELELGPALIQRREVNFEGWCIDALVAQFNELPGIRTWIAPRLRTGVWADVSHVYAPGVGPVSLSRLQRQILGFCDGRRNLTELAQAVFASSDWRPASETDVSAVLEELARLGLVSWRLEVPPQLHPERDLKNRLATIADPTIRRSCEAALRELVEARDQVGRSAGSVDDLDKSLNELGATFTRLTGRQPDRRAGEMYAGRSLVYEDCRRDCALAIGRNFLDRIGPPLSIVLDGLRWTASTCAATVRQYLRRRHAELRKAHGASAVDSLVFYHEVRRTSSDDLTKLLGEVQQCAGQAWQEVLRVDMTAPQVVRAIQDVRPRADDVFRSAGRVWGQAYQSSPDVMVAASSIDAFRRGDFHGVLGEVHSANSLLRSSLLAQHPNREAIIDAYCRDMANHTVVHRQRPRDAFLARGVQGIHAPTHWQYQFSDDLPDLTACRAAPAARFLAIDNGETVVFRSRDGQFEFDALELFVMPVSAAADQMLKQFLSGVKRVPRITIDDLTIVRARWHLRPSEMPFLDERDRASEFRAVREWAQRWGMPSRTFYKVAGERKPCYLDFNSPIYVAMFAKTARRISADELVCIEEMFPDINDTWLVDHHGDRYTCEFRLAATLASPANTSSEGRTDAYFFAVNSHG